MITALVILVAVLVALAAGILAAALMAVVAVGRLRPIAEVPQ